jgi:hypothetical protein
MKTITSLFLLLISIKCIGQIESKATLPNGKEVYLYNDKTWDYTSNLHYDKFEPWYMPKPSFTGNVLDSNNASSGITLNRISYLEEYEFKPDRWLAENKLSLNRTVFNFGRNNFSNAPSDIPQNYFDGLIHQLITDSNYHYIIYAVDDHKHAGQYLIITNTKRDTIIKAINFKQYTKAPYKKKDNNPSFDFTQQGVRWVKCINDTLYVSTNHQTYSDSSGGMNGYITCIDLKSMKVIWRSKPQISNAQSFAIYNDCIFSAYGFSSEPDFLYCLDRHTGRVQFKTKLKNAANLIILKDDKLHVRTYDRKYIFEILAN